MAEKKPAKKTVKKVAKRVVPKVEKKIEKPIDKNIEKRKKMPRLSKKELAHWREKLLAERDRILRELGRITESINEASDEQEAAKQSYSNHLADIGTDYMEKEKNYYYADQEGQYLKAIEAALERIERGDYGQCIECGELISEKRLEALPSAELCINCKDKKEKLERSR